MYKDKENQKDNTKLALIHSYIAGLLGALTVIIITITLVQQGTLNFNQQNQTPTDITNTTVTAIDVTDVVERVNPAVVSIVISKDVPIMEQYFDNPFPDFFGGRFNFQVPRYRQNGTEQKEVGGGSGFIVSQDGYIVTNTHVVSDEEAMYTVYLNDGVKYDATVIAKDKVLDIALIKIEADNLTFLEFADSENLKLGQTTIAIGNALGEYRNTVSTGVVSGLSRSIVASSGYKNAESLDNVIQTDAAINPGNSGGPLLNVDGKVIGVNVAVARGSENIGFALPSNAVSEAITSIRENGRVIRPQLGVRYILINDALKEKNNLSVDYGALVLRSAPDELAVLPGSSADKAGLLENDIILKVNGEKINEENTLANVIKNSKVGDELKLDIMRKGKRKTLTVILEEANNIPEEPKK